MNVRRCAVALILGAAMAGAAIADETLYLGKGRVYRGEVLDGPLTARGP